MSTAPARTEWTFFGHPIGLSTLFFTEMWERFSFYGMRALLVLYMKAQFDHVIANTNIKNPGLGFSQDKASTIYGLYGGMVYLSPIAGGWIADKFLGARRSVFIGGIIIACGHFTMFLNTLPTFFTGLVLIIIGTGLLKPNVSTMVGDLYKKNDERRDAGFSIFYMGINLGVIIGPVICGYLGQNVAWHYGFSAAGVGMVLGLIQYKLGSRFLGDAGLMKKREAEPKKENKKEALTSEEKTRLVVIAILFLFSVLFWMAFEQQGNSMNLFADDLTRSVALGRPFPSTWFQSVESVFIVLLAPVLAWLWGRMGKKQPSSPAKFAIGLFILGLCYVVMTWACTYLGGGRLSPWWLVGAYCLMAIGELCLSPIGLSTVTKLAPPRFVGAMMGLWFVTISIGDFFAGQVGRWYDASKPETLIYLFGGLSVEAIIAAIILFLLTPFIKRMLASTGTVA